MNATRHETVHRSDTFAPPAALGRLGTAGLAVGIVGTIALVLGAFTAPEHFFRAYLMGWTFWVGLAAGAMALLMIQHLSGGDWGVAARRIFEAATRTLPVLALGFIPLAFGLSELYPWAMEGWSHDHLVEHRASYLNEPWWIIRGVVVLAAWCVMGWLLTRWSSRQDETGDPHLIAKMKRVAAPGLVLYAFTATIASFDWFMSLDPHWYSTIYGVWFFGGHGLAGLAFTILVALFLVGRRPMSEFYQRRHFHDWGKLLLAFTMLWAYFSLSQFLIIWSGNVPEFAIWFLDRLNNGWEVVGLALALCHFALPFLLLLSRDLKRDAKLLGAVASILLVMHWVDYYWNVVPSWQRGHGIEPAFALHWLDVVAPFAIGGIFLWLFVRQLAKRPLVPINDPYLEEALSHGGAH